MVLEAQYEFRAKLAEALRRELIGPSDEGGDEVIADEPIQRYICGVLFPQRDGPNTVDQDVNLDLASGPEEGEVATGHLDSPVAMANVQYPSSMGLTFAVDAAVERLHVTVGAARYEEIADGKPSGGERAPRRRGRLAADANSWRRVAVNHDRVAIELRSDGDPAPELSDGLKLFVRSRSPDSDGRRSVTVALVNTHKLDARTRRDAWTFFQPEIIVMADESGGAPFVERRTDPSGDEADIRSNRLLYRAARTFAVGHGCSAEWDADPNDASRASRLWTTFMPSHELPIAHSNPEIDSTRMDLKVLAEGSREHVVEALSELCDGYEAWIGRLRTAARDLDDELQDVGLDHVDACAEAVRRMRRGVALLDESSSDEHVWEAFRLANLAMFRQRSRSEWISSGRPGASPNEAISHQWRPFQIGFILLCLEGIVDPASDEREIADLLWFPTGGGKTEAYLGLIAFTVFLRRLRQGASGGGVTALMRYTLRLLTLQQFERASLLICACESIRRERDDLGGDEIAIGLWVGEGAAPNRLSSGRKSARAALTAYGAGREPTEADPVQLHACPWCGEPLDHKRYWIEKEPRRLVIGCRRTECEFGDRLPAYVVDEDIYRYRPALLISTVDKFASLPWKQEVGAFFGVDGDPGGRPPELIIQDELHLISGPLGTLVGLYETAVDLLSTQAGVRPKVIASTATIRRADRQVRGLFDRLVRQFPPPGLEAGNSYFAVQAPAERRGTRRYVGLMAPGTSPTTLLVRTYATLLQTAADLPAPPEVKDPYWTLVGYFNSLRVLGGARMQVQDDVPGWMTFFAGPNAHEVRPIDERIELTSREPSASIPGHLKRMAEALPSEAALDVILATNMVSVGIDIDRLGLMVVMGQPQSTSEYIQATSRVGRQHPGLIVTLFNAARSRDRSHYESFSGFHGALYRQVEATSVTPFSARARDRGLRAVIVALARLLVPELAPNEAAARIGDFTDRLDPIREAILARVESIAPASKDAVAGEFDRIVGAWVARAEDTPKLVYSDRRNPEHALLINAADAIEGEQDGFPALWSLRDVDVASGLYRVR